jgi:DNA-binding beta-propeller fold protein YncE
MARTALTLLLLLACAPAAQAAPLGALGQLSGAAACTSEHGGACAPAAGLDGAAQIALSPDGRHAYAVATSSDAVAAFARDASGRLTQLAGTQGCVSETGSAGRCADGAGLDGAEAVAVSPDGTSVYVAARDADAIAVFARDATSGRLTQLTGAEACIAETAYAGCADGRALEWPTSVAVSPDGASVYVASRVSDAVAVLTRDVGTGALAQPAGADGCVAEGGAAGCASARGLNSASGVVVSPDGATVHAVGRVSDAVTTFSRDAGSGRLAQLAGAAGCVSKTGASGCAAGAGLDGPAGIALSADGTQAFVAAAVSRALAVLDRRAGDGALAPDACVSDVPDDSTRGTIGCVQGRALAGAQSVALSTDGASVYVASRDASGVAVFLRDPAGGALSQLPGASGCVSETGSGGACADVTALAQASSVAIDPAGSGAYVAAQSSDAVAAFARNTVARPPACEDRTVEVVGGTEGAFELACADPDGDAVALEVVGAPANGAVTALDSATRTLRYAPAAGFVGEDRIAVRASDGILRSQDATLTVRVLRPPRPPRNRPASPRTTFLLSRALDGGFANGPSRNAAVSHDQRIARVMAFESDASNLVAGDDNGLTDVFLVRRAAPWGENGTPWTPQPTELASRGLGGAPANGRSYRPALDGDSHHAPRCLAFVSEASNLVAGDTNGQPDAFVMDLASGGIVRVSVDGRGRQADGPTTEVQIDGNCERVAFVADAPSLALPRTSRAGWSTAVTPRPRRGARQVYVRVLRGAARDAGFRGLTFLASASDSGRPANRDAYEVALARDGKSLAFTSTATNLDRGDRNAREDVYRRTFPRKFRHLGRGRGAQTLDLDTRLVSATARGRAGNGPSSHPSITDQGRWVAFETRASDLLAGDGNGVSDIARADLRGRRVRQDWVSRSRHVGRPGNGASNRPVISGAGEFVLFDSEATNMKPSASVRDDRNGVRDVFLWNAPTGNVSLESRDAENGYLRTPSQHPSTSSRGNYVPFESADPLIDIPLADRLLPDLLDNPERVVPGIVAPLVDPDALLPLPRVATAATALPPQQVYMRYLGPK